MKLFIKSPIVFVLRLLKWSLIFAFVTTIKVFALQEYSGFFVLFSRCAESICVSFPAIYSLSFMDALVFLMKKKNKSFLPIALILFPLLLVVLVLQPLLYSYLKVLSLQSIDVSSSIASSSILQFLQVSSVLSSFTKQLYFMLDDFRQAYFEGYIYYLFFSFTYVFFLFSLSIFTTKARWNFFNLLIFFLTFRFFIFLYNVMNSADAELYIVWFSSNQLKGVSSYIISIGISSLIYFYGIVSRVKKKVF